MDWTLITNVADKLSIVLVLILALVGIYKGWWVTGREYNTMRKERDEWKALALKGTNIADRAVTVMSSLREDRS